MAPGVNVARIDANKWAISMRGFNNRYDKWTNNDGILTPRAATNIFFWDKKITTRLAAGRSFRRPSFDENHYSVDQSGGWLKGIGVKSFKCGNLILNNLRAFF